jgi:hypothetical protein
MLRVRALTLLTATRWIDSALQRTAIGPGRSRDCEIDYSRVATQNGQVPICALRDFPSNYYHPVPLNLVEFATAALYFVRRFGVPRSNRLKTYQVPRSLDEDKIALLDIARKGNRREHNRAYDLDSHSSMLPPSFLLEETQCLKLS